MGNDAARPNRVLELKILPGLLSGSRPPQDVVFDRFDPNLLNSVFSPSIGLWKSSRKKIPIFFLHEICAFLSAAQGLCLNRTDADRPRASLHIVTFNPLSPVDCQPHLEWLQTTFALS